MFSGISLFKTASALAQYAGERQSVITQNLANADTPGYRARDLENFSDIYEDAPDTFSMRATRSGHLVTEEGPFEIEARPVDRPGDASPNGNTVSIETEMVNAAENMFSHDLALTVYRSGLNILRTSLGGGR